MVTTPGVLDIKQKNVTKRLSQGALLSLMLLIWGYNQFFNNHSVSTTTPGSDKNHQLSELVKNRQSDVMVLLDGQVVKLLADDNRGSRHQKFIMAVGEHTVLVAHNIDLAPRVPIEAGEVVKVYGEYEWNDRGGVVHWTHDDPQNKHVGGWIEHNKKKFK